jgi:hypothetical protein
VRAEPSLRSFSSFPLSRMAFGGFMGVGEWCGLRVIVFRCILLFRHDHLSVLLLQSMISYLLWDVI